MCREKEKFIAIIQKIYHTDFFFRELIYRYFYTFIEEKPKKCNKNKISWSIAIEETIINHDNNYDRNNIL